MTFKYKIGHRKDIIVPPGITKRINMIDLDIKRSS